jgi:signal transduction histidine kinase
MCTPFCLFTYRSSRSIFRRSDLCTADTSPDLVAARLAVVGRLTASIAHDVNNSMAAVLGRLQILQMRASRGPIEVNSEIDALERDAQQASEGVQGLAALARQARRVESPSLCVLSDILREVDHFLGHHLSRKGIGVHLDLPPTLPPVVARPIDIKLLVAGLALSLLEAAKPDGRLDISAMEQEGGIEIALEISGRTGDLTVMPDVERLATLSASDGITVTLPSQDRDTAHLLVPVGSPDDGSPRRA